MKQFMSRFGMPILFVLGLLIGITSGIALANQPHMTNALNDLKSAQYELNQATSNKNGHRVQALNYVADAIQQVQWGIQAANGE